MFPTGMQNNFSILILIWIGHYFSYGEVVHLVGFSINFRTPDIQQRVEYQCYRSAVDSDADIRFGRYISTRSNETEPPSAVAHSKNQDNLKVIRFRDELRKQAYGVFYCHGEKEGQDPTTVLSFFIRSDAKFVPVADTFTRTVSVGERGVAIGMTAVRPPDMANSTTRWRINGSEPIESVNNHTTYAIDRPVTTADEGIYEIYYDGERDQARGSFFRLIVRACPPNRWGPPDCEGVCDKCYNGGVCDDMSGMCICPNGFSGPNCLTICNVGGGNRFGLNCEYRCSYKNDFNHQCRGVLFCLPDPFGCSCDIGSKGLSCRVACFNGEFGAGCTERCHCASGQCGIYTGECLGSPPGCLPGWSGENCQIPEVCESDYFGDDCTRKCHCLNDAPCDKATGACPDGRCARNYATYDGTPECQICKGSSYGFDCSQECHCDEEACDLKIGRCNGKCHKNWLSPYCIRGISRLTADTKVNPGQPSNVTCYAYGDPRPSPDSVNLSSDLGKSSSGDGIVKHSVTTAGTETVVVFDVASVEEGEVFTCMLAEESQIAILEAGSLTYDLPVMSSPPEIVHIGTHEVALGWDAWRPDVDGGVPPLTEYLVVYRNTTSSGDWFEAVSVAPDQNLTASITGLRADTTYEFAVMGVREGPGGIGLPSPEIRVTTSCEPPNVRSFNLTVVSASAHEIKLSWKKPPVYNAQCRSGFRTFMISYSKTDLPDNQTHHVIPYDASSQYTLKDLELCTDYTCLIKASNKDCFSLSFDVAHARTTDEDAPAPDNVGVLKVTPSTLTLHWSILNSTRTCWTVKGYDILYRRMFPRMEKIGENILLETDEEDVVYEIKNLWQKANYSIKVRVITESGPGPWSVAVEAQTLLYHPYQQGQKRKEVSELTEQDHEDRMSTSKNRRKYPKYLPGVVSALTLGLIIIIVVVVGVILYRRRRRKVQTTEPEVSFKTLEAKDED